MRNCYGIAAVLFSVSALLSLYYTKLEGRQAAEERRGVRPEGLQNSPCECRSRSNTALHTSQAPPSPLQLTTCSEFSQLRGGKQKVVSFSYYERNKNLSEKRILTGEVGVNVFLEGLDINIALLPRLYPGFLLRLYHDLTPADPLLTHLCQLACTNDLLDLCDIKTIPRSVGSRPTSDLFPAVWRFLPTLDPSVRVMMSRDLDSRITERERAAVAEWLESDKSLHAMRDHPWHTVPLMAGGWGAKLDTQARRDNWNTSWTSMLADSKLYSGAGEKGPDQDLLRRHVWSRWGRADCLQHDSYTCSMFPGSTGWPTQRLNTTDHNFFGAVGRQNV